MVKKAQHEMVGFVIIVILVTVIGVILFSLMIRPAENKSNSIEISNLLQTSMYYTTECAISYIPQYKDTQDLVKSCYKNERCLDSRMACEVLNKTLEKILDESLKVHEDSKNKAYRIKVYYKLLEGDSEEDIILRMHEGIFSNCSSIPGGSHSIAVSSLDIGTINLELEVCKS